MATGRVVALKRQQKKPVKKPAVEKAKVAAKARTKSTAKGAPRRRSSASAGEELAALGAVERIVSIPDDVVLAPQAEAPRAMTAREGARRQSVREMSWKEFDRLVQGIARDVHKGFAPEAVVGVVHGGVFVGGAIASALSLEFFPVRISRRSRDKSGRDGAPVAKSEMPKELKGRRVLLVDDVASSGDTLELARAMLEKVKASAVATATLVVKEEGYRPDYVALQSDALIVFPWDYELELPPGYGR